LDYGTTHSRVVEQGGGCSIKMLQQQLGMDVTHRCLQASDQTVLPIMFDEPAIFYHNMSLAIQIQKQ
jgi:hypothetical protein